MQVYIYGWIVRWIDRQMHKCYLRIYILPLFCLHQPKPLSSFTFSFSKLVSNQIFFQYFLTLILPSYSSKKTACGPFHFSCRLQPANVREAAS